MRAFIWWVIVTIFQDVASRLSSIIFIVVFLVLVEEFFPDYLDILFLPIMIGVPIIISIIFYPMPKDRKRK